MSRSSRAGAGREQLLSLGTYPDSRFRRHDAAGTARVSSWRLVSTRVKSGGERDPSQDLKEALRPLLAEHMPAITDQGDGRVPRAVLRPIVLLATRR